ncbi:MAG: ACP S-malonyltransferase [Alphaproteobacteria bacterium]|nr:ACP S-malonyltransferase [Alphaproteobacteria bacterium]
MSIACVFPGQGSQYVGMARALAASSEAARATLAEADEALGEPLSTLIDQGPEDTLTLTENNQPAILTVSVAWLRELEARGAPAPVLVAGHSLGEYSALVAAGALGFADAVRLVRIRGRAMQGAAPPGEGTMAALRGLSPEQVRALCDAVDGVVELAAVNSPVQVVVAGQVSAVEALMAAAEAEGCRATRLKVSAPFHCSLLKPAADVLAGALATVPLQAPRVPVLPNVDATPTTDPARLRAALIAQVHQPVLWLDSVRRMVADGVARFVEVGPGRTLAGLIKKTDRKLDVVSVDRAGALDALLGGAP